MFSTKFLGTVGVMKNEGYKSDGLISKKICEAITRFGNDESRAVSGLVIVRKSKNNYMNLLNALTAGLAGAVALTVTHQLLHKLFKDAPRMDLMGEEAITKFASETDVVIPAKKLYNITMAADIVGNSLYYALAATGTSKKAKARGTLLGLAAGIGGVYLPKYLGLTNDYSNRTPGTRLMTIAIYSLGGLVSGKVARVLDKN